MFGLLFGNDLMSSLLLSIRDTATQLGIGRTFTYDLINTGHLETVKLGRRTLVKAASIKAFIERASGGAE